MEIAPNVVLSRIQVVFRHTCNITLSFRKEITEFSEVPSFRVYTESFNILAVDPDAVWAFWLHDVTPVVVLFEVVWTDVDVAR